MIMRTQEFYCFGDFDWDHLPKEHYDYKQVCLVYPHDYGYSDSYTYNYDNKVGVFFAWIRYAATHILFFLASCSALIMQ